ncbi:NAD-dependent epimerase/dehydratase family protein [Dyadobacter psychrotolerans]|uniref:NAD-dependent epimerase/dehydratase family protein n=1 Tax=Dyadobacter psychrotolerans TaxID=2541721 RepID=A0A4R5DRN4_9BACT|nr:NAD-dependent epimerase/dehydratase family protein [Dyadobacter psychrotolerans]TDE17082.1 NAD-dependent epimerase/dehydratase family protein [Dyadobacter psychrotolerans]
MQTILGAGGDISSLLAKELKQFTSKIRLVSRNPQRINADDELMALDLSKREDVLKAIEGSDVVYLTVGLKYDFRIWQEQWPVIVRNVIEGCLKYNCKLVFFDNVYMYDKDAIPNMTEESPINPPSKKGKVRLQVVELINDAIRNKNLKALIARSADFYGPGAKNGILNILVLDNLVKGKKANWQSDVDKIHSFTYVPDAAKATALLGNTDSAYGQVWHLPTSAERLTGRQFIEKATGMLNKKNSYMLLSPFVLSFLGIFIKTLKELVEMQYQNTQDYFFNSDKFCKKFSFTPTSYEDGMREVLAHKGASS